MCPDNLDWDNYNKPFKGDCLDVDTPHMSSEPHERHYVGLCGFKKENLLFTLGHENGARSTYWHTLITQGHQGPVYVSQKTMHIFFCYLSDGTLKKNPASPLRVNTEARSYSQKLIFSVNMSS